ncbi:NAD-dependent epimerase/dehydratase family protein [Aeromicrobium terrae]|uniref:NAD-dependent epimerase/dehydratase family protein n=1 Tax=Aeromicrobium terrae TaxID=2498846 RepID=A0A5C8NFH7_9ACTN|nr:NAD-dependent epimerase/dehydratase family protein [Aeromicrobium terrae]TXL57673.1 NAD-dependent epimerase/dehydratase family protein [Aeromicrobium terrae]
MKVLLTGAAGFIGSRIALAAAERGHDVVGLDARGGDGVHTLDLRTDPLDAVLGDVDVVCHQAAMVGNGVDAQDLPGYAAHNDVGTAELLAAMARAGVKDLVLASSMVVYGDGRYDCPEHGDVPPAPRREDDLAAGWFDPRCPVCGGDVTWRRIGEDTPFRPRTGYAASKVAQEHFADAWCTLEGARTIALRYHNVYGPGMPADTPYSGVAAIFRSALARGEAPRVFEDGAQVRDFVHVDDVAQANVLSIEQVADHPSGVTPYNVASGHPFTIGRMAEVLAEAGGGPAPVVTGDYRAFDVRHVLASPDAAAERLGFRASVHPEDGLARLATDPLRTRWE